MLAIVGVLGVEVEGGWSGYMSLDYFLLRLTKVSCGVDGAGWANIAGICRALAILYIC